MILILTNRKAKLLSEVSVNKCCGTFRLIAVGFNIVPFPPQFSVSTKNSLETRKGQQRQTYFRIWSDFQYIYFHVTRWGFESTVLYFKHKRVELFTYGSENSNNYPGCSSQGI